MIKELGDINKAAYSYVDKVNKSSTLRGMIRILNEDGVPRKNLQKNLQNMTKQWNY